MMAWHGERSPTRNGSGFDRICPVRSGSSGRDSSLLVVDVPHGGTRQDRNQECQLARGLGLGDPCRGTIPTPRELRPLLATPSAASYSRSPSTAKGARRHGLSAIGGRRSRGRVQARPGIHLEWVTGQRHRHHLHETVLRRAFGHAAAWQGGLPRRGSPRSSATRSRRMPSRPGTTSACSRSSGPPGRQHTMTSTYVRNRRPATVRSSPERMFGP